MGSTDEILTTEQLADYLQVPVATIYRWAYQRTGPVALKIGRHRRYRMSAVQAWLDQQQTTAPVAS